MVPDLLDEASLRNLYIFNRLHSQPSSRPLKLFAPPHVKLDASARCLSWYEEEADVKHKRFGTNWTASTDDTKADAPE